MFAEVGYQLSRLVIGKVAQQAVSKLDIFYAGHGIRRHVLNDKGGCLNWLLTG